MQCCSHGLGAVMGSSGLITVADSVVSRSPPRCCAGLSLAKGSMLGSRGRPFDDGEQFHDAAGWMLTLPSATRPKRGSRAGAASFLAAPLALPLVRGDAGTAIASTAKATWPMKPLMANVADQAFMPPRRRHCASSRVGSSAAAFLVASNSQQFEEMVSASARRSRVYAERVEEEAAMGASEAKRSAAVAQSASRLAWTAVGVAVVFTAVDAVAISYDWRALLRDERRLKEDEERFRRSGWTDFLRGNRA
eukprot:TRINITY_DN24106_c0_g1_i2.p1 TRINITY_DN24106_c0_g1~~TRINITY_DN24106_c0_g1_i2.p1  ORF type:complete len:272 (-),score=48.76 TRINITY_DN24106_c0_g1_i2:94-843(-)